MNLCFGVVSGLGSGCIGWKPSSMFKVACKGTDGQKLGKSSGLRFRGLGLILKSRA